MPTEGRGIGQASTRRRPTWAIKDDVDSSLNGLDSSLNDEDMESPVTRVGPNIAVCNLSRKLKATCAFEYEFPEKVTVDDVLTHLKTTCPHVKVACPNEGCTSYGPKGRVAVSQESLRSDVFTIDDSDDGSDSDLPDLYIPSRQSTSAGP
ncbi:Hypp6217 [Branchiostoma lanceolatum]|uniref:Hypp6217 protein n=1 Tax=Branchiostoma lanceolatum TaxID=7740 RepID=A0A8J9VJ43_BRALA|nr:Hypp6217 [Branchiostoma lanceolatum]